MNNKNLIQKFLGQAEPIVLDYNTLMAVVEKIELITNTIVKIDHFIEIPFWFSKNKKVHFKPGAGGSQQPDHMRVSNFDPLGGKFRKIVVGITLNSKEKLKAASKLKAIEIGVVHFIKWYNKNAA